jgi:hypothetical protein
MGNSLNLQWSWLNVMYYRYYDSGEHATCPDGEREHG